MLIRVGTEIGVAYTKAFTCQPTTLAILVLEAAKQKGRLTSEELAERLNDLRSLPGILNTSLGIESACEDLSHKLAEARPDCLR